MARDHKGKAIEIVRSLLKEYQYIFMLLRDRESLAIAMNDFIKQKPQGNALVFPNFFSYAGQPLFSDWCHEFYFLVDILSAEDLSLAIQFVNRAIPELSGRIPHYNRIWEISSSVIPLDSKKKLDLLMVLETVPDVEKQDQTLGRIHLTEWLLEKGNRLPRGDQSEYLGCITQQLWKMKAKEGYQACQGFVNRLSEYSVEIRRSRGESIEGSHLAQLFNTLKASWDQGSYEKVLVTPSYDEIKLFKFVPFFMREELGADLTQAIKKADAFLSARKTVSEDLPPLMDAMYIRHGDQVQKEIVKYLAPINPQKALNAAQQIIFKDRRIKALIEVAQPARRVG